MLVRNRRRWPGSASPATFDSTVVQPNTFRTKVSWSG